MKTKTNPKIKEAMLDLLATILDCNEEGRAMFWFDYSGHVSCFSVRKAEGDYNQKAENFGWFQTYANCNDDYLEDTLADIAEKKARVIETAAKWTDEKMAEREAENKKHRLEMLKQEIAKLEA